MIRRPKTEKGKDHRAPKTGRVIVVDDHTAFRQALAILLEQRAGVALYAEAASPAEARKMLQNPGCRLDLAIVDLDSPDGEGLVRELNEGASGASVLCLTADHKRAAGMRHAVLTTEASAEEILAAAQRLVG